MLNDDLELADVKKVVLRLQPGEHLLFEIKDDRPFLARFTSQQRKALEVVWLTEAAVDKMLAFLDTQCEADVLTEGSFCSSWELAPALKS